MPSETWMRTSSPRRYVGQLAELGVVDGVGYTSRSPKRMTTRSWSMSVSSWHLPMAMATRPQLGSAPCTAVLTSGELTIALATRLAWSRSRAPSTTTSISVSAPSPSRAICLVSDSATAPSAASSSSDRRPVRPRRWPARPRCRWSTCRCRR